MSHTARPWPNNAAWARDSAAEALIKIIRQLAPLVVGDEDMTHGEQLRHISVALHSAYEGLRDLEQVGAQTRKE